MLHGHCYGDQTIHFSDHHVSWRLFPVYCEQVCLDFFSLRVAILTTQIASLLQQACRPGEEQKPFSSATSTGTKMTTVDGSPTMGPYMNTIGTYSIFDEAVTQAKVKIQKMMRESEAEPGDEDVRESYDSINYKRGSILILQDTTGPSGRLSSSATRMEAARTTMKIMGMKRWRRKKARK